MYNINELCKLKSDLVVNMEEWACYKIDALVECKPHLKMASTYLKRGVHNWLVRENASIDNMVENAALFIADEFPPLAKIAIFLVILLIIKSL